MKPTMAPDDLANEAERLRRAYTGGAPVGPVRNAFPAANIADAYAIQQANTAHWTLQGRTRVGAKIGLTAKAVQQQLGVDQPDFGTLFADMAVLDEGSIAAGALLQPKVEAEIAFVMARMPDVARLTTAEIINSVAYALPAIEIVDSRIANWDICIVDTIADNASSGLFVLGVSPRKVADLDLRLCGMVLEVNGDQKSFGAGAACLGNPLHALGWLAKTMADNGAPLTEGDVVLSGALGPMVTVSGGDYIEARIEGLGVARVGFAAE